jgi:hypothetical protein
LEKDKKMNADEKDMAAIAVYRTLFEEYYLGIHNSLGNCVKELMIASSDMPEWLASYIDWEKIGKDWKLSGDLIAIETDEKRFHLFLPQD